MNLMTVYNHSPIYLQNVYTSIVGYLYKRSRYGHWYRHYLEELTQFDEQDEAAIKKYQNEQLCRLVRYASIHSPFYRKLYSSIDIVRFRGLQDLENLPIVHKEEMRQKIESLYTIQEKAAIVTHTSGTTGKSMLIRHRMQDFQQRMAILDTFKARHGFVNGQMKKATFNSARIIPPKQVKVTFWRDNIALKQRIYSGYHCRGENMHAYIENLNEFKPAVLDGYPSALYELAKYILCNNIPLTFQPICIFPSAETLYPHYRQTIEQAFRCKVYDQYASSEGAPFITECRHGSLHYNQYSGIIEVLPNGEMLVTGFSTYGTPLIRYAIGDRVTFDTSGRRCACGSSYPIVLSIEGRSMDYLQSKSNGRFTGTYLLESDEFKNSLVSVQFVQNSLEQIDVKIVADSSYDPRLDAVLLEELDYIFGSDMKFVLHKVAQLPKEESGKFRLIVNNLGVK